MKLITNLFDWKQIMQTNLAHKCINSLAHLPYVSDIISTLLMHFDSCKAFDAENNNARHGVK